MPTVRWDLWSPSAPRSVSFRLPVRKVPLTGIPESFPQARGLWVGVEGKADLREELSPALPCLAVDPGKVASLLCALLGLLFPGGDLSDCLRAVSSVTHGCERTQAASFLGCSGVGTVPHLRWLWGWVSREPHTLQSPGSYCTRTAPQGSFVVSQLCRVPKPWCRRVRPPGAAGFLAATMDPCQSRGPGPSLEIAWPLNRKPKAKQAAGCGKGRCPGERTR